MIATWSCCPVHKKFALISFYYREFLLLSFGEEARDNIKLLSRVVPCPLQRKLAIISAYLRKCLLVSFTKNCANFNLLSRVSSVNIYRKYSRQCRLIIASFFCCPWQKFAVIAIDYREFILSSWTAATRDNIGWLSRVLCCPFKTKLAIVPSPFTKEPCDNINVWSQVSSGVRYKIILR